MKYEPLLCIPEALVGFDRLVEVLNILAGTLDLNPSGFFQGGRRISPRSAELVRDVPSSFSVARLVKLTSSNSTKPIGPFTLVQKF